MFILGILAFVLCIVALLAYVVIRVGSYRAPVHADEIHTVVTTDLWGIRLVRYKAKGGSGEPVFVCHGFMSNHLNFAIPAGEAMLDSLSRKGYDCWAIDLRGNLSSTPPFGRTRGQGSVDDYLLRDIPAAIQYIRKATGYAKVHWIGHSMGGMLLYAYDAAIGSKLLASATTLGSPIGFDGFEFKEPTFLLWLRRISPLLFRTLVRPAISVMLLTKPKSKILPFNWDNMNPKLTGGILYGAFEAPPLQAALDMAHSAASQTFLVKNGEMDVVEHLKHLQVPLFAVYGEDDPFVPVPQARTFFENIPHNDKRLLVLSKENGHVADYSHVDLVMGGECEKEVFQPIAEWLSEHPITEMLEAGDAPEAVQASVSVEKTAAELKPAPKKRAARKTAAKEPKAEEVPAKKAAAKKPVAKKSAAKEPPAKKTVAKKAPAKKRAAKPKAPAAEIEEPSPASAQPEGASEAAGEALPGASLDDLRRARTKTAAKRKPRPRKEE